MIEPPEHRFQLLHQLWRENTGQVLPARRQHLEQWARLESKVLQDHQNLTMEKAIILVAQRIKALAKNAPGWKHHLSFWRFTDETIFCDDHLAAALSEVRKPKVNPGYAELMRTTGRSALAPTEAPRKADEILASQGFKELLKLRDTL